ncbi:MAG: sulfite exporter TauE/SafE family protein [Actinomycetota bacterium]|nr:sulfite exporter TauE/SafE family protein [Actinomycetota bacterium]
MSVTDALVAGLAAFVAGLINAIAGGGTLISFPALVALGVPAVSANVTNTVALVPGYLGGAYAQRKDLVTYFATLKGLLIVSAVGGLVGSVLLVNSPERLFRDLVPFLIIGACLLLGVQDRLKAVLARRHQSPATTLGVVGVALLFPTAVYGGYFGAGLGIMLLAVLGLALDDPLPRINSLKSTLSLCINLVAAAFFVFSGKVQWDLAAVMAVTSLVGGTVGGRIATRLDPKVLRIVVIVFGLAVAVRFFF